MSFIQWNAKIEVDGAEQKFIGLGWGLVNRRPTGINSYTADITVEAHPSVAVRLVKSLPNEHVVTKNNSALAHGPGGIELRVTYNVTAKTTATGKTYATLIAWHSGTAKAPGGFLSNIETGAIGTDVVVTVTV